MPPDVTIRRLRSRQDQGRYRSGIDAVFFQSSNTQTFADAAERESFRDRWLGHYLSADPEWVYLALGAEDDVAGYLVGSLTDPSRSARFADIGYFRAFAAECARFPAHLHVNLLPAYRDRGIGSRLVSAFAAAAQAAGAPGIHVMTARGARNIGFYGHNGFAELASTSAGEREIVLLGRAL